MLGRDLLYEGVSCIEFSQIGIDVLVEFADSMGIEWFIVADNDPEGNRYVRTAKRQVGSRDEARHISQLAHGDLEVFLCNEGYGHIYEANVSPQKASNITCQKGDPGYWTQVADAQGKNSKPRNAVQIIEEMERRGIGGVPSQLREIIEFALELAEEARDG